MYFTQHNKPSFKISTTSPALKLNSSVSCASYAYSVRHFGKDGLGGSPGLGRPGAGGRLVLTILPEMLRLILKNED
jgi:hypothetical protein